MRTVFKLLVTCLVLLLLVACGTSNKIIESSEKSRAVDEMVADQNMMFAAEWARPFATQALNNVMQNGLTPPGNMTSQINIQGNGSFFKMEGDSVSADLSYYGERRMGGGYGSDNGIVFDGLAKNLKIEKDENKQRHDITFNIAGKGETYRCRLQLYSGQTGTLLVNSSHRNTIRYDGKISAIDTAEVQ